MKLDQERGFTLFELIVAIAIVGLIMGIAVTQMDRFLELDMKKTSNKLGATIRYLYNKSATEGLYIRLICDLNEQTYWVEATTDPTKVSAEMEMAGESEEEKTGGEVSPEEAAAAEGEAVEGEAARVEAKDIKIKYPQPRFGQVDSFLLKPTRLPDSVFFKDVYVEHYPSAVEGGKAAVYFFPNGYVEHAVINLRNEDDDYYYSIETNPISGKVNIENEYKTMEGK